MADITKETKKNAYLYCKFRDEQLALYDEYAKRHGMLMKTLLVVNVLYYDDFYGKNGVTQTEICQRTFQSMGRRYGNVYVYTGGAKTAD